MYELLSTKLSQDDARDKLDAQISQGGARGGARRLVEMENVAPNTEQKKNRIARVRGV